MMTMAQWRWTRMVHAPHPMIHIPTTMKTLRRMQSISLILNSSVSLQRRASTTGGAEINTHADAEEVVGATIIAEGVVETPEVVEDTVITEEEEAIREVVASVGVVHTEDTESEVRTKDNTNIETV
mmetsp:Transcript_7965/g.29682  ORF Transcript_7965/g.29682 Transcript_7965/m.29682 type:complete len:126 (-) Transcript_7965:11-388(-)